MPTLNISRYVYDGTNELQSGISHRTNQATECAVIHDHRVQRSDYVTTEHAYDESCPVTIKK